MKTIKIIILSILLTCSVSHAQFFTGFGVKSGLSISNQSWDYTEFDIDFDDSNFTGLYLGVFYEFSKYSFFSTIAEISYIQKGFVSKIGKIIVSDNDQGFIEDGTITITNKFEYISFSTLAKFQYDKERFSPFIQIGPRIDIQIRKNIEMGIVSNKFNETTWGYSFGGGIIFTGFEDFNLILEGMSSRDFSNLYKTDLLEVKKYSYEIKLGLQFK